MTWVRYDDSQVDHPKILALGALEPLAGWLNHRAISWCAAHHTDGSFCAENVRKFASFLEKSGIMVGRKVVTTAMLVDKLLAVGLWERTPEGYRIHDFLDYQISRADATLHRAYERERKAQYRHRRQAQAAIVPDPEANVPPGQRDEMSPCPTTPTRPVPSGPVFEAFSGVLPASAPPPTGDPIALAAANGTGPSNAKRQTPPARRFPADFTLTPERLQFATDGAIPNAELEFAHFRDHHQARGNAFVDWDAAWRTWCRNVKKFAPASRSLPR